MNSRMGRHACLAAAFLAALSSGCATIVKGTHQSVTVKTTPPGANCELKRQASSLGFVNPTPGTIQVDKSKTDLSVICNKSGHLETTATLPSSFQSWSLGNILIGGLIGIAVDAGSGAMHEYQPEIVVMLAPASFDSEDGRNLFFDNWQARVYQDAERAREEIRKSCPPDQCDARLKEVNEKALIALAEVETARAQARVTFAAKEPAPKAAQPADARVQESSWLKRGDKWTYALTHQGRSIGMVTIQIDEATEKQAREQVTIDRFKSYTAARDIETAFQPVRFQAPIVLPGGYRLMEIAPYLPADTTLKPGETWRDITGEVVLLGHGRSTFSSNATVVKQERIRVPAGEFDTWRIETTPGLVNHSGNRTSVKCTYWYAPSMRRSVKMHYVVDSAIIAASTNETYELASYSAAK